MIGYALDFSLQYSPHFCRFVDSLAMHLISRYRASPTTLDVGDGDMINEKGAVEADRRGQWHRILSRDWARMLFR